MAKAQLAIDPNQANMAQQTLLQLEATGDVPVYQWCGIGTGTVITVYNIMHTAMHNIQEIVTHCCICSTASASCLAITDSQ